MKNSILVALLFSVGCASQAPRDTTFNLVGTTLTKMPVLLGGIQGLQERIGYPDLARKEGRQGRVILSVLVGADGRPREITIVQGLGESLDRAASRAMARSRFTPAEIDGVPVEFMISLPITFKLRR